MGGGDDEADRHQHAWPADGVVEGVEGAVQQHGRQAERSSLHVGAGALGDVRRNAGQLQQVPRVAEDQGAGHGEHQGQPETLLQGRADSVQATGAEQVRHRGRHGLQDADQQHHHRDVEPAAHRDRGQVGRAVATGDQGIGDHHAHRQDLRDEHRPGVVQQLARDRAGSGAGSALP